MAGDDGRRRRSRQAGAVVLVLCALAQSLTCFSLQGLREKVKQDEAVDEATAMDSRTEGILSNWKGSASAAAMGNDGLLHTDLDQSDGTGISSQLEDNVADEAAWRRLNPSLHCGQSKMKIKAMGPGAADLKLDMGDTRPLLLIQVPESCGYAMRQNALGLILVVPYDGCNVLQENGNYVFQMSWQETPVKFTCPMLTATPPASTTPKPAQQPWELPFPLEPESVNRHKRHVYDPNSAYYSYMYYLYYMNMLRQTTTTTTKPGSTTVTIKPTTTKPSPMKPPVHPYNPYYYYNPYYHYYYPYYYPLPVKTTTAKPSTTTGPVTGTSTAPTTKAPVKTPFPYFPYYHYPYHYHYPPAGQQMPGGPIYYYPVIQHYHGTPPPKQPMKTTLAPSATAKPTTTTKPCPHKTKAPTTKAPTTKAPTTKAPATKAPTTKAPTTKPSSNVYPGPIDPYVPYHQLPFGVLFNKAGKLPADLKYMPQAGYKSGAQARAHPGFDLWQPMPWLEDYTGKDLQFDWAKLQPK